MANIDPDDPFLQVQADVHSALSQTRPLFSSYLRIRSLTTSPTSPELLQSRSELLSTLSTLSTDLADLVDSVRAVEHDPYRYGFDTTEVSRRRKFVQDVEGEIASMRRELQNTVEHSATSAAAAVNGFTTTDGYDGGGLPDHPHHFDDDDDGRRPLGGGEDPYGEFEAQQQVEMMHEQDEQLDGVFRTVGVLRGQAEDMGRELEDQSHLLAEVDTLADRVGGKLEQGVKKVGYIIKKNEDTVSSCCIAILIFVLILLLVLVIIL